METIRTKPRSRYFKLESDTIDKFVSQLGDNMCFSTDIPGLTSIFNRTGVKLELVGRFKEGDFIIMNDDGVFPLSYDSGEVLGLASDGVFDFDLAGRKLTKKAFLKSPPFRLQRRRSRNVRRSNRVLH